MANQTEKHPQKCVREGRFLSRLQHRNLPRVQRNRKDRGGVYLVLEEFEGATLEQNSLTGRRRPWAEMSVAPDQFLDVLEYLHGQDPPKIHRDLSPTACWSRLTGS